MENSRISRHEQYYLERQMVNERDEPLIEHNLFDVEKEAKHVNHLR